MRIGVCLPEWTTGPEDLRRFVRTAQELDYASIWCGDHLVVPARFDESAYPYRDRFAPDADLFPGKNFLEAVTAIAYAAGAGPGMSFGFAVLVAVLRHPILLAKQLATIDVLSGGRLVAGLGAGWLSEEMAALGVPPGNRGERMDEVIRILRTLWTGEQPVAFDGRFYAFDPLYALPRPAREGGPPIWVGGHSDAALRRCARHADGWLGLEPTPERFREVRTRLAALRGDSGRDLHLAVMSRFGLRDAAAADRTARTVGEFRDAGCDHLILMTPPGRDMAGQLERLDRFADLARAG